MDTSTKFYIARDGNPAGPYTLEEMNFQGLKRDTLVWNESMTGWTPAYMVPELAPIVTNAQYDSDNACNVPPIPGSQYSQPNYGAYQPQMREPCPKTWLVESILVTLFCCLPFGIVGIIYASKVESNYLQGDMEGAYKASRNAGKWTKLGFFIAIGIYILLVFEFAISGSLISLMSLTDGAAY